MKGKYTAILAVFVFTVFFFSIEARAVDWKFYAANEDGDSFYDPQSIKRVSKDVVRVWNKIIFSEKAVQDAKKKLGPKYKEVSYLISLFEYNCSEKKRRTLSFTYYKQNMNVIDSFDYVSFWRFIIPDSAGELLFNTVCGGR